MPKLIQKPTAPAPELPIGLKPYVALGVDIAKIEAGQARGNCPFCTKEGKFYINLENGKFDCKRCGITGNPLTFIRQFWEECDKATTDYSELAAERPPLTQETLMLWGCCRSILTNRWLIPSYDLTGKIHMLLRWTRIKNPSTGNWPHQLIPVPGVWPEGRVHGLFGLFMNSNRQEIRVCEGPWDGMALWQSQRECGRESEADVVATPSANIFSPWWGEYFSNKRVVLLYDNDHPMQHQVSGNLLEPVGYAGMKRAARLLTSMIKPPLEMGYIRWASSSAEDTRYNPSLPNGYDVRDHFSQPKIHTQNQSDAINTLLAQVTPIPDDWKSVSLTTANNGQRQSLTSIPCESWKEMWQQWSKAMTVRQSMSDTMATMCAVCLSTIQQGDGQLFLQVIGDAGSGKTQFCNGLLVSKTCYAIEQISSLHSGWKDSSGEDFSLIARANGKTWITPEADVIMSSANFAVLFSQIRRAFDGETGNEYGNMKEKRKYTGLRTPWIMAGTPALLDINQARLGDRFIRVILTPPDTEEEKMEILRSVGFSAIRSIVQSVNGSIESHTEALKLKAYQLTGGFVDYLRSHAEEILSNVVYGTDCHQLVDDCAMLAEFTAYMRASPGLERSHDKRELAVTKEMPTRLEQQLTRMALCLAGVFGESQVNNEVFRICRKIADDTSTKRSKQLCSLIHSSGDMGETTLVLANTLGRKEEEELRLLTFLQDIGVVQSFVPVFTGISSNERRWRLTERFKTLWEFVYGL